MLCLFGLCLSFNINETLFGSKGRDVTTAEHFHEPLKPLGFVSLNFDDGQTLVYAVWGEQEAQIDSVTDMVWGSEWIEHIS